MKMRTFLVFLVIAAVLVGIGIALQDSDGSFHRWLASLHGAPRH